MLYGAVVAMKVDSELFSTGDGYEVGIASSKISRRISVGKRLAEGLRVVDLPSNPAICFVKGILARAAT